MDPSGLAYSVTFQRAVPVIFALFIAAFPSSLMLAVYGYEAFRFSIIPSMVVIVMLVSASSTPVQTQVSLFFITMVYKIKILIFQE